MSLGVPMLLAGDEMGRTQGGNNNAYCQDNEISWVDWKMDDRRRKLLSFTRRLIELRHKFPVLQRRRFFVGDYIGDSRSKDVTWLRPDGTEMTARDWQRPILAALGMTMGGDAIHELDERGQRETGDGLLVLMNAHDESVRFKLPTGHGGTTWLLELDTDREIDEPMPCQGEYDVAGRAVVVFRQPLTEQAEISPPSPQRAMDEGTIGTASHLRRAGVLMPLFSMRRKDNWGLGDIADLPRFAQWAARAGFSVVQLLPVNAVGALNPSPYAAISAFALDPVYLSLDDCEDFVAAGGRDALPSAVRAEIAALATTPIVQWSRVRAAKGEGVRMAFERFHRDEWLPRTHRARELGSFRKENNSWLDDYALFVVLHEQFGKSWQEWPLGPRERTPDAIAHRHAWTTPMPFWSRHGSSGSSTFNGERRGASRAMQESN